MPQHALTLRAPADSALSLWFEPWGEGYVLAAGAEAELHANSRLVGELSVDVQSERVVVYGWGGSTLRVFVGGLIVASFDQPVPPGMDRASIDMMFRPASGEARRAPAPAAPARPWWRFWGP